MTLWASHRVLIEENFQLKGTFGRTKSFNSPSSPAAFLRFNVPLFSFFRSRISDFIILINYKQIVEFVRISALTGLRQKFVEISSRSEKARGMIFQNSTKFTDVSLIRTRRGAGRRISIFIANAIAMPIKFMMTFKVPGNLREKSSESYKEDIFVEPTSAWISLRSDQRQKKKERKKKLKKRADLQFTENFFKEKQMKKKMPNHLFYFFTSQLVSPHKVAFLQNPWSILLGLDIRNCVPGTTPSPLPAALLYFFRDEQMSAQRNGKKKQYLWWYLLFNNAYTIVVRSLRRSIKLNCYRQ